MPRKMVVLIGLSLALAASGVAWWYHQAHSGSHPETVLAGNPDNADSHEANAPLSRIVNSGPMARDRDFFRVIDRPEYLAVEQAADSMSDDEIVIGLELADSCRAYPVNYLNDHEMVRDEINGVPLLITW